MKLMDACMPMCVVREHVRTYERTSKLECTGVWRASGARVGVHIHGKTLLQCWFPSTVELFDEERHRLETWRTGAVYHRSTDRGRENGAAALVSEHGGTLRRRTIQT
ncbi:hypothetical protein EVAR_86220_1 [Eumeta japonica]|uniref:Uncharacterized protein n=1 Tax=Eumeta variegata TaxID=151549 RepID=A0A4C1UBJ4_EUMVA|nr:hypothetical protein EVAR_86220_1 [Eumeta japonica]